MSEHDSSAVPRAVEYREIQGFPGYRVGSDGTVWSQRRTYPVWRKLAGDIVSGYRRVVLYADGSKRRWFVHRLVLEVFVGPCPEGMEACHGTGIKLDNSTSNLRWDTSTENNLDRIRHGTMPTGESSGASKLTDDEVMRMKSLWMSEWLGKSELALLFGVTYQQVNNIVSGKHWRHVEGEVLHV